MTKLPRGLSGRQVRRALERAGFYLKRQKGSHMVLRRDSPFAQVVVPAHASIARAQALIVQVTPFSADNAKRIVELAAQHRLPAMYDVRSFVEAGGLVSYGPSLPEMFRRAAFYVDRILKGAKPADLPIEQPTKFEFVINLKTAKTLELTIPQSLLARADQVLQ